MVTREIQWLTPQENSLSLQLVQIHKVPSMWYWWDEAWTQLSLIFMAFSCHWKGLEENLSIDQCVKNQTSGQFSKEVPVHGNGAWTTSRAWLGKSENSCRMSRALAWGLPHFTIVSFTLFIESLNSFHSIIKQLVRFGGNQLLCWLSSKRWHAKKGAKNAKYRQKK